MLCSLDQRCVTSPARGGVAMNSLVKPNGILRQSKAGRAGSIQIAIIMLGILLPGAAAAQGGPPITVTLVNSSNQTVLFAAFGTTKITPPGGEAAWVQPPGGSLTLNIPPEWYNTQASGTAGPRFWARTGCKYNVTENRAQCETGDCAGQFECQTAGAGGVPIAGKLPVSIAEFCLNCVPSAQKNLFLNYWDVSIVDGANLSLNIEPTGPHSSSHPGAGDPFWCQTFPNAPSMYAPNSVSNTDLRESCPKSHQLLSDKVNEGPYIKGESPNNIVACFSNCGAEVYPTAPALDCKDSTDKRCGAWRAYCCQANDYGGNVCTPSSAPQPNVCKEGDHICIANGGGNGGHCPGKPCTTDADCAPYSTCWNTNSGPGTCACSGYVANPPCPDTVCTNQDLPAAEPPFGKCSQTKDLHGIPDSKCIGDDTVHAVFPRAYTWPNDPQTYDCDNNGFTITISPGGVPASAPAITPAGPIPLCSSLPKGYHYKEMSEVNCSTPIKDGAKFAAANYHADDADPWSCDLPPTAGIPTGRVLCSWNPLPTP